MKKGFKLALLGLGIAVVGGLGIGLSQNFVSASAEGEPLYAATVVIDESIKHGTIETSIVGGDVGAECVITAKADFLHIVESVSVNGTALIEDENVVGKFTFILVGGDNVITASFILDEELLGEIAPYLAEIESGGDFWTIISRPDTIIAIVKWLLDGGILIALIRYYVKDKKLEKKLEDKVQTTINGIIPQSTKDTVNSALETTIIPIFTQLITDNGEMKKALGVFAKCMALSQENTPDSRRAIIDELSGLKISDTSTIEDVKKYIENLIKEQTRKYEEAIAALGKIGESNKAIIEETKKEDKPIVDSGIQI